MLPDHDEDQQRHKGIDYQSVFLAAPAPALLLSPELIILEANDAYLRATKSARQQILDRYLFDAFPDNPGNPYASGVKNLRASLERVKRELKPHAMAIQRYDTRLPVSLGGGFEQHYWNPLNVPVLSEQGSLLYIIHRVEDVTELILDRQLDKRHIEQMEAEGVVRAKELQEANAQLRHANEELTRLAHYDSLTQLPNRLQFLDRFEVALVRARYARTGVGLVFIDLDNFKAINDSLGHTVGDQLLQAFARRLRKLLHETDLVARLSGDEFAVIVQGDEPHLLARNVAQRILDMISTPLLCDGHELFVSASIGISVYPEHGTDVLSIMKNADVAMHAAKRQGRNTYQAFFAELNAHASENQALTNRLYHALAQDEFVLHYQPRIELATGRITGVEALIRWNHPTLGMILPSRFIHLAEDSGMINAIGDWVLRTACMQMASWQTTGVPIRRVAINLSARQFKDAALAQQIRSVINEFNLSPDSLEVELTESMVIQDPVRTKVILNQLKSQGIRLAIDDFGMGYSSLSYLKRFPIDYLKIDKSFVQDIPYDEDDVAITKAIIALAKSLKLRVIAEGVETEDQRCFLQGHACEEGQGFLFGKPGPAAVIESLAQKIASQQLPEKRS